MVSIWAFKDGEDDWLDPPQVRANENIADLAEQFADHKWLTGRPVTIKVGYADLAGNQWWEYEVTLEVKL